MKKLLAICCAALVSMGLAAKDYNICDYGAKNDTTLLSTEAIQRAIDVCAKDGGGRVVVPAGQYKTGTIVLRSHVELHVAQGATLFGSTDLKDYRPMATNYVSLRTQTKTIQLIYADDVEDVVISGQGTIDGRGRSFKKLSWNDEGITRPHLLRFIQSSDIRIKDITLKNSGCWMQHYLACDRLTIEGIRVENRNNFNNDALDLDGCHEVIVRGMIADSDDDGITLKSTSPRLCENIRISDCVVSSHCNAIKLGTETNGGFRNINISGIVVKPSYDQREKFFGQWIGSSAISLEIVDGGVMENVSVSDITVEGTESPIFVRLGNRGRGYQFASPADAKPIPINRVGSIRGIHLTNIHIRNAGSMGCSITGLPGHPVEDVYINNVTLHHKGGVTAQDLPAIADSLRNEKEKDYPEATMWGNLPAKGFYVRHARNVQIKDFTVKTDSPDVRPEIVREDDDEGSYKNPVLNADFSDPDVIRVGNHYYMVASDFHFIGMQVLESEDMIHWRYASQVYSRFNEPGWDTMEHYAGGSWAPSLRYHDGRFYIYFCTPDEGLYMTSAADAHGPWDELHLVKRIPKWEDPCPFWDEDGQAYLVRSRHGAGPIIVHHMSADGRTLLDEGTTVYEGPVAEGPKWLKRGGYYYLLIPEGGVGQGWQTALRSKNIYGPYERKIVLEQGTTEVNGPHQGALVDTPDGTWWFYHFQEMPVLGRVVHLQPVRWQDGWPLMGADYDGNGIGEPVAEWKSPLLSSVDVDLKSASDSLQTSDDFNAQQLGLQWQWNHNPQDKYWSLTEHPGRLTLHALPADSLKLCRNMLTQKMIGNENTFTTKLTAKGKNYQAGLACIGKTFCGIGLSPKGIFVEQGGQRTIIARGKFRQLWLRLHSDNKHNRHQFFYSTNGQTFTPAGPAFSMRSGYWKGIRPALFCYGNDGEAQFDDFFCKKEEKGVTLRGVKISETKE